MLSTASLCQTPHRSFIAASLAMVLLMLFIFSNFYCSAQEVLHLVRGQKTQLSVPKQGSIYVGNGEVISVKEVDSKLILNAKKIGQSELIVGNKNWKILVLKSSIHDAFSKLSEALTKMKGLSITTDGHTCIINGRLLRWTDLKKIAQIQRNLKEHCQVKAKVVPEKKEVILQELRELCHEHGLKTPNINLENFVAQVPASLEKSKKNYEALYRPYGLEVEFTSHQLDKKQLVLVKLYLIEASRSFSQQLGVSWSTDLGAMAIPKLALSGNISAQLNALESSGQAQVLAAPTLVSKSGGTSKFFAGGEIPLRTSGYRKRAEIIWKSYGIRLDISPTADWHGNINLTVSTEVSAIDQSVSVENLPGFKTSRLDAEFDLQSGQTVALSGLIKASDGKDDTGLPFLRRIPLLGQLFRSDNFLNNRSELLILVAPEIVDNSRIEAPKFAPPTYEMIGDDPH